MNTKPLTLTIFLLPLVVLAQSNYEKAIIETKTGGYLIFTNDSNSLVIYLDTAKLEPIESDDNFFVQVDNQWILQLFVIDFQNPNNKNMDDLEVQKSSLLQYRNYEINYFKDELKLRIENEKAGWGQIGNKYFLLWHFETPDIPTIQKQIHLSTICFDKILNINIPLTKDQDFEEGMSFLDKVANGLKIHDHPTNIEDLYRKVNGK